MNEQKSLLNPDATPYVPLLKVFSSETNSSGFEKDEDIDDTACFQPLIATSGEYTIQSAEKVHVSDASSSKIAPRSGVSENDTFQDESHETTVNEGQIMMDDPDLIVDTLSSMFPNLSINSLAELLKLNHGDVGDAIDMLEQLEFEDDGEFFSETSGTGSVLDRKGDSSRISDST